MRRHPRLFRAAYVLLAVSTWLAWQWLIATLPDWFSPALLITIAAFLGVDWFLNTAPVRRIRRQRRLAAVRGEIAPGLRALFFRWDEAGRLASDPATSREINAFEKQYRVVVPEDMRAYFQTLNGTKGGELGRDDGNQFGFWHFDQERG